MRPCPPVLVLAAVLAPLALISSGVGLAWLDTAPDAIAVSPRGEAIALYGQGLYRNETPLIALGHKAADAVMLVVDLPVLVVAMLLYRRGSMRGGLLLNGVLAYLLYLYSSRVFGAAYNELYLLYLVLFSVSLYAFVLIFISFDRSGLPDRFADRLPRRAIITFMTVAGLILPMVWVGLSVLPALFSGGVPGELAHYTTLVTHTLDVGVLAPALLLGAALLRRGAPLGYLLAATLLIISWTIGSGVIVGAAMQSAAGLITVGQATIFVIPFVLLTVAGLWLTAALFGSLRKAAT